MAERTAIALVASAVAVAVWAALLARGGAACNVVCEYAAGCHCAEVAP